ncbi:hypothetical protein BB8028_0005g00820 [Beauveria bassiana]|uniref:Uncharacterized protein n=1 Tax=Beauveria bassiana TaxID=176275 RepID=A0A2S7YED7_BEABA|nr:hypothetical protein BB8028_0005g00820 [Beauveria bassiana]
MVGHRRPVTSATQSNSSPLHFNAAASPTEQSPGHKANHGEHANRRAGSHLGIRSAAAQQWQDHLPPSAEPLQGRRDEPGELCVLVWRDGDVCPAARQGHSRARAEAEPPGPLHRPEAPRPPPLPRARAHAAAAAQHHRPAALYQAECLDAPVWAAGRPPRKEQQPGHARGVHDYRQRAAREPVHFGAPRDEPAQLRGVCGGRHRGRVRRRRLSGKGDGAYRGRGRHVAGQDGVFGKVCARGCRARGIFGQDLKRFQGFSWKGGGGLGSGNAR